MLLALVFAVGFGAIPLAAVEPSAIVSSETDEKEVIVVLENGVDPVATAREMGVEVKYIYRHVFNGFAGAIDADSIVEAQSLDEVKRISSDGEVSIETQTLGNGVLRAGMQRAGTSNNLSLASPIDADIAILDTGVTPQADLNVVGGKACNKESKSAQGKNSKKKAKNKKKKSGKGNAGKKKNKNKNKAQQKRKNKGAPWRDDEGHGTHVAGIAAAIDNDQGIVGIAPGARIWAVKVLDSTGKGTISDVICGLDWVVANKDIIDVANLSLSTTGEEGTCQAPAFHRAICAAVDAGIPVVVAAGNQKQDVAGDAEHEGRIPARYDEVITVSSLADSDGSSGGNGPRPCYTDKDDKFSNFSSFGADVDIVAPGECIVSLRHTKTNRLATQSGTSSSAPFVSGAVALHVALQLAANGVRPTPAETKNWLLTEGSRSQSEDGLTGDPDGIPEPVLWLDVLGSR